MKKQIAILASIIAASGFTAMAQDWISVGTSTGKWVYDEFTTPGTGVLALPGDVNIEVLWATTGVSDTLPNVGASFGQKGGAATDQVATNGVSSFGGVNAENAISSMLAGGWTLAQNYGSGAGTAALGTVEVQSSESTPSNVNTAGQIGIYNGDNPFEVSTTDVNGSGNQSGTFIDVVFLAFSGSSYQSATALGWSNPVTEEVGSAAGDVNGANLESTSNLNQFGVVSVPEPATLALAGLGGLSMLFLRRRKA